MTDSEEIDFFRPSFKYLKARKPPPDFSTVTDFSNVIDAEKDKGNISDDHDDKTDKIKRYVLSEPSLPVPLGLKPVSEWQAYHLSQHPGFVIILNPFKTGFQRYWIKRCMQDYNLAPNVTNLDAHLDRSHTPKLFDDFVKKNREELHKDDLLMKLRWVTLGYHYDWTAKKYYAGNYTEFPWDLAALSSCIAEATGHTKFTAEAGIVNYYHMDSTLAGHTDHSEFDKEAPLISISFGQDAVFLLGGTTKAVSPSAMYLHSGDICVMGGQSRMAYHAVPRILPAPNPAYLQDWERQWEVTLPNTQCDCSHRCSHKLDEFIRDEMCALNWKPLSVFLKTSRINVNIRQVLKPGQSFPKEATEETSDVSNLDTNDVSQAKKPKVEIS